jgi:hypothetical protein
MKQIEMTRSEGKKYLTTLSKTLEILNAELLRLEKQHDSGSKFQVKIDRLVDTMEELEQLGAEIEEAVHGCSDE